MALTAGTRLGPYAILAPLGAGGMGEVYRALDARLEREVAIKVLPAELASDTERLKRFEKEARSASSLNHPNIVTIHDIGSERGVSYIAMERVEGSTLRELMAGGPLSLKRLLAISTQITEGLARAHEAGIVHRDLKPENVMVTKEGLVKILDFGLAKLESKTSGSGEGSQLPTMTGTSPGVVVGTVGYMSPEQASAAPLDFHSDQFALGSILYEMASGKRAFQKKTAVETLTAILNEEPEPLEQAAPQVPAPLRWIVERCHSKQPEDRYVSTRDLARELAMVRDHASEITSRGGLQADVRAQVPAGVSSFSPPPRLSREPAWPPDGSLGGGARPAPRSCARSLSGAGSRGTGVSRRTGRRSFTPRGGTARPHRSTRPASTIPNRGRSGCRRPMSSRCPRRASWRSRWNASRATCSRRFR